jgi:hypothetical protein
MITERLVPMQLIKFRANNYSRGMHYEFLPPYSPDYNPIEEAFSAIKAYICQNGNLVHIAMSGHNDIEPMYVCMRLSGR